MNFYAQIYNIKFENLISLYPEMRDEQRGRIGLIGTLMHVR